MNPSIEDHTVHTLSERENQDAHVILTATGDKTKYTRRLEERLAELERTVQGLIKDKAQQTAAAKNKEQTDNAPHSADVEPDSNADDKDESSPPIVPKARKLNCINFSNRFPVLTEIPVVEAMMIDTTFEAADCKENAFSETLEDLVPSARKEVMLDMLENNVYKPDAWMARIRINSPQLTEEIMKIVSPDQTVHSSITFIHPFDILIDHHEKIKNLLQDKQHSLQAQLEELGACPDENPPLALFLETYVSFIETDVIPFYPSKATRIRFASLSSIFHLGDTIYFPDAADSSKSDAEALNHRDDQRLWRLYRIKRESVRDTGNFILKCYAIDHDGETFVCVQKKFLISSFVGEKEVTSLPVFPLRYAANGDRIQTEHRERGQLFLKYSERPNILTHTGWALDPDNGPDGHTPLQYVTSDVVVDMVETLKTHPSWKPAWKFPKYIPEQPTWRYDSLLFCTINDRGRVKYRSKEQMCWLDQYTRLQKIDYCTQTDPFLSTWYRDGKQRYRPKDGDLELLPRRLFAYVLQDRRFLAVDIRNMKNPDDQSTRAPSLIINPDHQRMIRALVESHLRRKELHDSLGVNDVNQDIIANKGKGLVLLLYGVPGVGKTSTAEYIAHSWKKPLLPITCGDLGTNPSDVEAKLRDIFRLAQHWDCILLLDEADVFLSERTPTALERNALVSVFLRMLEYYAGILFLTTNLPGSIDEAFKSRIHISLYYPHLDKPTTLKIWKMNLGRLQKIEKDRADAKGGQPLTINVKGVKRFAMEHFNSNEDGKGRWNGRQIRNAFLIASALAHYEKDHPNSIPVTTDPDLEDSQYDVKIRHFKVVAEASMGFERYLTETKGRTASEIMFQRGQRSDFLSSPEKLLEPSFVPTNDYPGKAFADPATSSGNHGWGTPIPPNSRGYHAEHQRGFNGGNPYAGHEGYPDNSFGSPAYQNPRARSAFSRGGGMPAPRNTEPQRSSSPWNEPRLTSHQARAAASLSTDVDPESDSDLEKYY